MCGQHSWVIAQWYWESRHTCTNRPEIMLIVVMACRTVLLSPRPIIWRPSALPTHHKIPSPPSSPPRTVKTPGLYGVTGLEWIVLLIICFTFIQASLWSQDTQRETNWLSRVSPTIHHLVRRQNYNNYTHALHSTQSGLLSSNLNSSCNLQRECSSHLSPGGRNG